MTTRRTSLASLVAAAPSSDDESPATTPPERPAEPVPAGRQEQAAHGRAPRYAQLTAKSARLRSDQVDALTTLARRIERTRPTSVGERITENTLIRVAVDLLLTQADRLSGNTEAELTKSLH